MEESSIVSIPVALFEHLDVRDQNNPEIFQFKLIEEADQRTDKVLRRSSALEVQHESKMMSYIIITKMYSKFTGN